MTDADEIVIEALLDDVLDADLVTDAVDEAVRILEGDDEADANRLVTLETQIAKVDAERGQFVAAIAAGGHLESLVEALRARETERVTLEAERKAVLSADRLKASEADRVREELLTMSDDWAIDPRKRSDARAADRDDALARARDDYADDGEPLAASRTRTSDRLVFAGKRRKGWRPQGDVIGFPTPQFFLIEGSCRAA